ncbi:SpoIIAA family protein [Halodesulfovibrio spirochaetisodalis]|uniref:STAS/SEC14 domain-containing protein n=1 Tax=Halodesulfovibrio spirochaetisodalis TaxID=1560234 RepID=A0A1B7XD90_9BACT|nr:STAS/SEC14 domain-containing protein [Halodesulfovibrio spirochaetisodalis]OBQ51908.1 hypothetical protein SP90_08740 [Halodesulfovibrio spirochaetisodalis]
MLKKLERSHDKCYGLLIKGPLDKEHYDEITHDIDEHIRQYGQIALLLQIQNVSGYTMNALLGDLEFFFERRNGFSKIAIVAEHAWWSGLVTIEDALTPWDEKYFDVKKIDAAWEWLES